MEGIRILQLLDIWIERCENCRSKCKLSDDGQCAFEANECLDAFTKIQRLVEKAYNIK